MSIPYSLPQDLEKELRAATARVITEAIERQRAADEKLQNLEYTVFCASRCCLDDVLSDLARDANSGARDGRVELPNEVWTAIWQDMPLLDRVNVTHVCQRWREIALGTPGVWCSLDFWFSSHAANCACVECSVSNSKRLHSNALIFHMALPRSLHLPLSIHIGDLNSELLRHTMAPTPTAALVTLLCPHASRISSLELDVQDARLLPSLLQRVNSFPTLTALKATTPFRIDHLTTTLAHSVFYAPALRRLSLNGSWCSEYTAALHLPAVEILQLYHRSRTAVGRILDACPNVRSLDVWFPDGPLHRDRSDAEAFRIRVAQIPHVRLSNICSKSIRKIRLMYDCPDRPNYEYSFDAEPEGRGISVLGDVNDATLLCCTRPVDDPQASIVVTSATRRRALIFRVEETTGDIPCIWSSAFHGAQIAEIECRWDLWYLIAPSMPALPALEVLRFTAPDGCNLLRPPVIGNNDVCSVQFPALRRVILQGVHPKDIVPTLWWNAVMKTLNVDTPTSIIFEFLNIELDDDWLYDWGSSSDGDAGDSDSTNDHSSNSSSSSE